MAGWDWDKYPTFLDVIIYIPGTDGGPRAKTLERAKIPIIGSPLPGRGRLAAIVHNGGTRIRVDRVTDEYVNDGTINRRTYCGSGPVPDRELWFINYWGGDEGYGKDPTYDIITDLDYTVLRKHERAFKFRLGKVMMMGSSGGAKATLRVAEHLCKNDHVDYIGLHDAGLYKPWAQKDERDDNNVIIIPPVDVSSANDKWNWYQSWGNKYETDEKHGLLRGFNNIPLSVNPRGDGPTKEEHRTAADNAHVDAVEDGEKKSWIKIKGNLEQSTFRRVVLVSPSRSAYL